MKKNWKRKLAWFTIALILTLLVGTVVLVTVLQHKKKENIAWQERMQAEQIAEINAQTDAETQMHAGAGVQIGSGQEERIVKMPLFRKLKQIRRNRIRRKNKRLIRQRKKGKLL